MLQNGSAAEARVLSFSGSMTIRQVADAHACLVDALACGGSLSIDVADVAAADLSFVQLIESARQAFAAEGHALSLATPADGALRDVLERGGFLAGADERRRQFWIHSGAAQ